MEEVVSKKIGKDSTIEEAIAYAFDLDGRMKCTDFNGVAHIIHLDGSTFTIKNAIIKRYGRFVVVYAEHQHPMVWFKDDLYRFGLTKYGV